MTRPNSLGFIGNAGAFIGHLDAINYIKYTQPIPVLFQFSRLERNFGEKAMKQYFEAAGLPKQIKWYSAGHEQNDPAALRDRGRWLSKELKFSYDKVFSGVF